MSADWTYLTAREHLAQAAAALRGIGRTDMCAVIEEAARLVEDLQTERVQAQRVVALRANRDIAARMRK